jgi:hypothetical protein
MVVQCRKGSANQGHRQVLPTYIMGVFKLCAGLCEELMQKTRGY